MSSTWTKSAKNFADLENPVVFYIWSQLELTARERDFILAWQCKNTNTLPPNYILTYLWKNNISHKDYMFMMENDDVNPNS